MVYLRMVLFIFLFQLDSSVFAQRIPPYLISPDNNSIYDFFVSPSDKLYFSDSQTLWIYNINEKSIIRELSLDMDSPVTSIVVDEGEQISFLGTKSGNVAGFDINNGNMIRYFSHKKNRITSMVCDEEKKWLFIGGANGKIYKHSIENLNIYETIGKGDGEVTSIKKSEDGDRIAVSWSEGRISFFNAYSEEEIVTTKLNDKLIRDLAYSSKENRLLAVSDEGILYRWRVSNKEKLVLLEQKKVSGNWLLTVDIVDSGLSFCYGGVNHSLVFESPYGKQEIKFKGPVLKSCLVERNEYISFITCIYGKGIYFNKLEDMKSVSQK